MRRRVLLVLSWGLAGLTAGALVSQPAFAADPAQTVARVGFVGPASPSSTLRSVSAFWERLRELGYVEGQNLVIVSRWAEGQYDRLPALMAEVVGQKIDVLVTYSTPAAVAAKNATSTIPIVAAGLGDPVGVGLVASLAHPGGNLTGLSTGWTEGITAKWLELLREAVPRLTTVAVIENPDNPVARDQGKELQAVARTRNLRLRLIEVRETGALDRAFEQAGQKAQGALVLPDPIIASLRGRLTALAAKHRLPTIYYLRDFVDAGGLMAYGPDFRAQFRRAAEYVDKILKGAKPSELPVEQPTKFELVVNLKTAKALGITIPESILIRADEVIR